MNFLSGTLAGLPLHLYQRSGGESKRVEGSPRARMGRLSVILRDAANDEASSFAWRKAVFDAVFTHGRAFTFIERNALGEVINLWPLNPASVSVVRSQGRTQYHYSEGDRRLVYEAGEIIDIPFMLKSDGLGHRSPILTNAGAIGMAMAATQYSSKLFANGGVPPLVLEGPLTTAAGVKRASEDMVKAVENAAEANKSVLTLPTGHTLKPLGIDPDKQQLIELQRFCVVQVARIYSLPPAFLQDLTHGTFSNTEQQDLQLIKHTLQRWVIQFEQELNLKLFGRADASHYAKFNLDGLQRGDFKTRMEGISRGIGSALFTPNEGRALMELPAQTGGDVLLVQGRMCRSPWPGGIWRRVARYPRRQTAARKEQTAMATEKRAALAPAEVASSGEGIRVSGYAAVFNQETDIGGYWREVIAPGAFSRAIGRDDVVFLINHDGLPLARTRSGTLTLIEDDHGLKMETMLDPADPDVASIVPKMKRGDLDKMSFSFRATVQEWMKARIRRCAPSARWNSMTWRLSPRPPMTAPRSPCAPAMRRAHRRRKPRTIRRLPPASA